VHPYIVVVSVLDPWVKGRLDGTDKEANCMMLPDHFETLWLCVVDHVIAYCLGCTICVDTNNIHPTTGGAIKKPTVVVNIITLDKEELLFGGMERIKVPQHLARETDHDVIRLKMNMEIDLYLQTPGIEVHGQDREFAGPLLW
jgi:hypothetical protein